MIQKIKPQLIGILNITEDSFHDAGKYLNADKAMKQIDDMVLHGANIIDIGAESTRSGFNNISEQTQLQRTMPLVEEINKNYTDVEISIDTRSSVVAHEALKRGASIVNDVSSGTYDSRMLSVVSDFDAKIILTHMPEEHQNNKIIDSDDIINDIKKYFSQRISEAISSGISEKKIIVDPGISFGKSGEDNIKIIRDIGSLVKEFERVCLGVSNKRFASKIFSQFKDEDMYIASLAITAFATCKGVMFLRVHEIDANKDALEVAWKTCTTT
jgi:dihydropteroate synthase